MRWNNATTVMARTMRLFIYIRFCLLLFPFYDIKKLSPALRSYVQKTTWVFGFWILAFFVSSYYLLASIYACIRTQIVDLVQKRVFFIVDHLVTWLFLFCFLVYLISSVCVILSFHYDTSGLGRYQHIHIFLSCLGACCDCTSIYVPWEFLSALS